MGAIRGWMQANTDKKWIKWSGYQEWFELYGIPESYEELKVGFVLFILPSTEISLYSLELTYKTHMSRNFSTSI